MKTATKADLSKDVILNPKQDCLVLSGYGLSLKVDSGKLIIDDGFINEGKQRRTVLSRGINHVERIVILGHSGNFSLDAIRWLMDAQITTTIIDNDGEITTSFDPSNRSCSALKKAQALAHHTGADKTIAEYLITKKIEGQIAALRYIIKTYENSDLHREKSKKTIETISFIDNSKRGLREISDVEDALLFEGSVAYMYWRMWEGIPLKWFKSAVQRAPEHWQCIQNRTSGKYGEARHATDPVNAMLNFCYSILEAKTKTACIKVGLDINFGIIHANRDNRAAFVYDIMEPVRPIVDGFVLEVALSHKFKSKELHETREGVCRLDPDLMNLLITNYPDVDKLLNETLIEVKRILQKQNKGAKDSAPLLYHTKRVLKKDKKELYCIHCGAKIETQGKKFCSRECYFEWKKQNCLNLAV